MKTAVVLFLSSMTFSIAIALIYWLTTREPAGTILLGLMATVLSVVATYMVVAERNANLAGDKQKPALREYAGERLGLFTAESWWPLIAAFAAFSFVMGILLPWWGIAGIVVLLYAIFNLARESR